MTDTYAVGLTTDGWREDGTFTFGEIDLGPVESAGLDCQFAKVHLEAHTENSLADFDAIISLGHA